MGIKKYKPTSPGRRGMSTITFDEITKPTVKSLLRPLPSSGGRGGYGRISIRYRGGRNKRFYRLIDFKRNKWGVPARVAAIEYDPNRSVLIALLNYVDGEKRYILAPKKLKIGDTVITGKDVDIKVGNTLPLRFIPTGTEIHNIELRKGKGGQIVRAAGTAAQLVAKEGDYAHIKLPSTEIRLVHLECLSTIGQLGNVERENISIGKAGANRWRGRMPHVRGVAMNPVDHPLGGGEGKTSGGRHPVTPWGKPTKGFKTRHHKETDKMILKRRKRS